MTNGFCGVQRIVLSGARWQAAAHLMLRFPREDRGNPLRFLNRLLQDRTLSFVREERDRDLEVQFSLGLTRRGLRHAHVPDQVLACFALKAPAFWAGAASRAAAELGLTDDSAPRRWDPGFAFDDLDAVLSVHTRRQDELEQSVASLQKLAGSEKLDCLAQLQAVALAAPQGVAQLVDRSGRPAQWVHFDYRDGLSSIGIEGWTSEHALRTSRHRAGEFVLGHVQDSGANPWISGPGLTVWPTELRCFFHGASFGVLQQIEQDVGAFQRFLAQSADESHLQREEIKAKLCGRYSDGRPLADPNRTDPAADFDYAGDPDGYQCPFGSHARRMNPRLALANGSAPLPPGPFGRSRPLLRRGMPYGKPYHSDPSLPRGLLAQFFCASIEDQYEHLLGQWADRVPMGSLDRGGARDPLIGAHTYNDGPFEIPRAEGTIHLDGLQRFTRTRGVAYLFYPSENTLQGIANNRFWNASDRDDD